MISKGLTPPVVTDEWWLDIVEFKEGTFKSPDLNHDWRWIFPLPFGFGESGRERGLNIAWTALQLDWCFEGMDQKICQITHPDKVFEYLKRWPGLWECARDNPSVLALYAPQLTISEFSAGLDDVFDKLVDGNGSETYSFSYGEPATLDGKEALCGDIVAFRHPTFSNLTPQELSRSFVSAHDHLYSRQCHSFIECLAWLLHDESNWLPSRIRSMLFEGMTSDHLQWNGRSLNGFDDWFVKLFFEKSGRPILTKDVISGISEMLVSAALGAGLVDSKEQIIKRFLEYDVVNKLYMAREQFESKRHK